MEDRKKEGRYQRLYTQLEELTCKTTYPLARMASICAVLHHKMDYYFWTGFYLLKKDQGPGPGKLVVGPYQGPVACQELDPGKGVCWAAIDRSEPVVVPDVHAFPGHHACDSRSLSEITLPVKDSNGAIKAVFDVDSDKPGSFSEVDSRFLQKILELVYK
ncbi:MAG: GAF domain-containing protein [Bacteroidetes bacterium]|nr:GAF domain-containing protein [Bacteroidota bacterium]